MAQVYKLGSKGPQVKEIQNQLKALGWLEIKTTTDFYGELTVAAVRKFQRANDLVEDGRTGGITWKALFDGYFPTVPAPVPGLLKFPSSIAEAKRIFGSTESQVYEQLRFCPVPDVFTCFGVKGGERGFTCHKLVNSIYGSFFRDIAAAGLAHKVYSFDGCWNWRTIRGSTTLSNHAFGAAIDINYEGNTLGDSTPAMDLGIVEIAHSHKLSWGGDYRGRKDGMHFECFDYGN